MIKRLKPGMTVRVQSKTDLFDHQLTEQDILDIKSGEWREVGFKIITKSGLIYDCLKFGILPWWCYEKQKHYNCSYWAHLYLNLHEAWSVLISKE